MTNKTSKSRTLQYHGGRRNDSGQRVRRQAEIKPTEIDVAMLAAYVDGEGCISACVAYSKKEKWPHPSIYIELSVHNTDPRLVDWCQRRWGGRIYQTTHTNKKWMDSYGWKVTCKQAMAILEDCLPYFIIKREQAEVAIALERTKAFWGRNGAPEHVHEKRWELRNQLSALKGKNARIKITKPSEMKIDGSYTEQDRVN